jgi:hypothetical protein
MAADHLTRERVLELLAYDKETGEFTWKPRKAGHTHGVSGYVEITIDGIQVKAHRLAWLVTHGEWPTGMLDHINGDPSDNRLKNLRAADARINAENRRSARAGSKSKLLGAQWHKQRAKWQAAITVHKRKIYLGIFDTQEEAHEAFVSAKRRLHQGCTI